MKKIEEDILGWFNLTEYLWFSFGERYRVLCSKINSNSGKAIFKSSQDVVKVNRPHILFSQLS